MEGVFRNYRRVLLMRLLSCRDGAGGAEILGDSAEDLARASRCMENGDDEGLETALTGIYCRLHGKDAVYSAEELGELRGAEGYWCYAGGLEPLFRAGPFIGEDSVTADLGAGNGLQGLLMQVLFPHRKTVQVELSSHMIARGRRLQDALNIPGDRIEWRHANISSVPLDEFDLIYLYRPARPVGEGRTLYRDFARKLGRVRHPVVVFSVADCMKEFMGKSCRIVHDDGHLVIYRHTPG